MNLSYPFVVMVERTVGDGLANHAPIVLLFFAFSQEIYQTLSNSFALA